MNLKPSSKFQAAVSLAVWFALFAGETAFGAAAVSLEGQNKGNTNTWSAGNLQNWVELDYVPCRLHFGVNLQGSQPITLYFDHLNGTVPGFVDLYNFTSSSNLVITAGPTLSAPATGPWSYTFTVNILNNQESFVWFSARLAAGSHLNTGSSLSLSGLPSNMGNLQIHKPAAGPGVPDLGVVKTGSTSVCQGGVISYTLSYTNRGTTNTGVGVQISDILPAYLTAATNSLGTNAHSVGNTIFWDLPDLATNAGGKVTFQAAVDYTTPLGTVLTNFAQILSSQNDANTADNSSTWQTLANCACTNASVITPPSSTAVCPGGSANFSVVAGGPGPLTYQWRKNGTNISGATGTSYSIASAAAGDAGSYTVAVSNLCGGVISAAATLTVNQNLVVSSPPTNQTVCAGSSPSFSVSASGTGLAYQWYKGATVLAGRTGSSLNLTNVTATDAGTYSVVVSGTCGSPVTNSANLTVNANIAIVSGPQSLTNCPGTSAAFSVSATGTGLSYQWYQGGSALGGQTGSSLTLNNITVGDAGTYRVVVSGVCGGPLTNSATLTVDQDLVVSVYPTSATNCPNSSASFAIVASGTGLTYQWYKNNSPMAGQAGSSITLNNIGAADAAVYSVVASGICGNAATNSANLVVNDNVAVSTGPSSVTTCAGASASFSVSATGTGLSYQWSKGASPLAGKTGSSLTLTNASATDAGTYSVTVSGACGSPVTSSATLTVNDDVVVSTGPTSLTNCPGIGAIFSVTASGTGLAYQWYKGTNTLTGETNSSLTLTNVSAADADTYSVVVSGACGSAVTNSAALTVNEDLVVSVTPSSMTNCPGTTANFNVSGSGTGLSYQWFKDGSALAGETGSSLTLNNVSSAGAGTYSVVANGTCGNSASNSATLTINQDVVVSSAPVSLTNCPGTSASFSVTASGTGLSYQWYRVGSALPGQTGSTLTLNNVSAADAGIYSVVVSGTCGSATNLVSLTVNQDLVVSVTPSNLTNCPGTTAIFGVAGSGTGLSYQWFKNGSALAGETGGTLTLNNVTAADAGTYSVVANGTCGNSASNSATLTINQDLVVSSGPVGRTNCPGSSASFSVSATGTGLTYQWYKGASPLAGRTGSSLTLTNVSATDAGTYSVTVSGACGSPVTSNASLAVNDDLVISSAPVSLTNCPGNNASFSVTATGTGLNYQWFKGTNALTGETNSSLTLTNATAADADTYSVVVSGACGSAVTNGATLTVNQDLVVSVTPASMTNCPGTTTIFGVSASGTGLSYQWFKNEGLLAGQTNDTLTLNNVSAADAGTYSVVANGTCGNSASNSATLTINENLVVASGPADQTVCAGASASFSVSATGTGLSYQWYKGANALAGQTGSSLTLNSVSAADAGNYTVMVSGTCGAAQTVGANLVVNAQVIVMSGPAAQTVCAGASANFSVSATGTGLSYQWYKGASPLAGQTGSSLTLNNVSSADAGSYSVVVSGTCGSVVSSGASLTVNQNVVVTSGPVSLTNCPGTSASFSVLASGTGLSYQWYKGASALAGQTGSSLALNNVSAADAGTYSVTVSGVCGNSVSSSASLTVNQNVVVASGPVSVTNCPGTTANFSVSATGTGLSFQWYKGASSLAGRTGSSLTLNNVSAADAGTYSVTVSGVCGNSVSSSADLAVNENVVVATPPVSVTNCPATTANFNVSASGTGLSYQWYKGTNALSGETGSSLTLNNVSAADAGGYSVVVSGTCGNSVTNLASLTVNENLLVASGPADQAVCAGGSASFSVNATGTALTYQWLHNGSALAGATNSSLNLANAQTADRGRYDVVVSGSCGAAQTVGANLVVNQPVLVLSGPVAQTVCAGNSANFSVTATGTGLSYQWYKGASALAGQTGSSLTLNNVTAADAGGYSVVVNGTCGSVVSSAASLTVNQNVAVASGPVSLTNCPGTTANFSVSATGTGLTYQWYKGASALTGQTGSSLTLNNVSAADAGAYSVTVSGVCGNSVSSAASLTVNQNVVVASGPVSLTNCPGTTANFSVSATGTGLSYQWYKEGSALAGQTGSSLTLNNVSAANAGNYSVTVSGTCGNSVSSSASLTMNQNVVVASGPAAQTVCTGGTATFTVSATGTGLSYQWYKGASALAGRTNSSLVLSNVSATDAGSYSAVVNGTCGSVVTGGATLTVNQNLVITTGPADQTVCAGGTATFSVSATGTGLSYQWYKGASLLAGQTGSTLTLNNVTTADALDYSVTVSATCGNSITRTATLIVNQNVVVASGPVSLTNCPGTTANFNVSATGTGLTYQWYKGASALAGQTGSSLTLNNVSAADAGAYSVTVGGTCGNSASSSASLTVNQNVVVASGPVSLTNCPGTTANFNVSATGTGLTYQWYKGASALAGQTGSSLTLNNVSAADAGAYSVTVGGTCGNSASSSASLTVNQNVVVASGPVSLTNCPGTTANFSVSATGTSLSYQWHKGASPLAGQTGSSLALNNVSAADAGTYSVTVSGICGNSVSSSATLTVNQNVSISTPPVSLTNCPGTTASFSIVAGGTGMSCQWYKGGSALPGQNTDTLTINNVSAADAGTYSVIVSGACGSTITNLATLTVNQSVAVATAPVSLTNCPGTSASFNVTATGTSLTYQWYKDGTKITGQTGTSLTLNNASSADAGTYSVTVSGACGNSISSSANLAVNQNVVVSSAPASLTNCPGTSASFSVSATGTGLSYQWYKGASPLAGQTGNSLAWNNVSSADAGTYSVTVGGTCGNSVSSSASLTVNQNVVVASAPVSVTNCPGTSASFSVSATGTGLSYQWYKGGSALAGQTGTSLTLNNVSAADAGNYSVTVSGVCGNSVSSSANLAVSPTVSASPLSNVAACTGQSATFSTVASGAAPLTCQWQKNGSALPGQTNASLTLTNVSATDAATYSVVVSGGCGSATQSATLTVKTNVSATSLTSLSQNLGSTAIFSTVASGSGPYSYVWKKNGVVLAGQTNSSLTLTNLSSADGGSYSVDVSGGCSTVTKAALLIINQPPIVSIVTPTNGTTFVFPQAVAILANASDSDGTVKQVEIFQNGSKLSDSYASPYSFFWTNVAVGNYQLTARATDDMGLMATSSVVNITVLNGAPTAGGPIELNRQNGLFEQTVTISNPTPYGYTGVRLWVYNLTSETTVWNATGTNNGVPYLDYNLAIPAGSTGTLVVKYYIPSRHLPSPVFVAQVLGSDYGTTRLPPSAPMILSCTRFPDGSCQLGFDASAGYTYFVQYCSDLLAPVWKTAGVPITGTGGFASWTDSGPPNTESNPATQTARFYRLMLPPQ